MQTSITEKQKQILLNLEELKETDLNTVDRSNLVDIRTVEIDTTLPKEQRMLQFLEQIKNPYCYRCGDMVVKVIFDDDAPTLEEKMVSHFKSLM